MGAPVVNRWLKVAGIGCLLAGLAQGATAETKPALLFCTPQGPCYGWLDLNYANELHAKGFEVDCTETLDDVTWNRIKRYHVLVIYITPDAMDVTMRGMKPSVEKAKSFADLIERYIAAGGGVLLMPSEGNMLKQAVVDLTGRWGAKLPVELIEEKDPQRLAVLAQASQSLPLAVTENILASPVSEGVRQIWYPLQPAYNAQHTGPLVLDGDWQTVVKGSATSITKLIDLKKSVMPELDGAFSRPEGSRAPILFAIRRRGPGRIALVNQWRQYSVGSGTKFIFDRQVLAKGAKGRPSDFGRLLENTYRWLAAPSLASGALGGYVTPPAGLQPPNQNPKVRESYADHFWPYDRLALGSAGPPPGTKLFRGLIGARTTYSSGKAGVEAYARAAVAASLDFLVFADDFSLLDPRKLQRLKDDCRKFSTPAIKLLPGFSIRNNVGNSMFFFAPDPAWIPDRCLTGANKKTLYIQEEDGKGGYTGYITPFLDWVLNAYHVEKGQVGYYNFSGSPHGMRMHDLRLYGMAAVRYYRGGQLVEDNTEEYLTTAQATIPPAPVSFNEVASPEELSCEVAAGHTLVYASARSLEGVFPESIRWTHQYDAPNVSMSDGPRILSWPNCHRTTTLGGEEFVTGVAVMPCPLAVTSDKGLKELRIYNGQNLFRRFLIDGAKEFRQTLVLDGSVQKNLVLIAEDVAGNRAISFARRCWADGGPAAVFCSDHVNDGTMALAHGPYAYQVIRHPALPADIAGDTWDGGPSACLPLTGYQNTVPAVEADCGSEDGSRFDQIPLLEFSDESALAVSSVRDEVFDEKVKSVVNPWHTYGPIGGPSRLIRYVQRYRELIPPTIGVPQTGWAGPGVRLGGNASLFREEITLRKRMTVKALRLGYFAGSPAATLVMGLGGEPRAIEPSQPENVETVTLPHGGWFGYFRPDSAANSNLFFNRGETLRMERHGTALFFSAPWQNVKVEDGQRFVMEIAALGLPVTVAVRNMADLERYADYLRDPTGMHVLRGKRIDAPGLVELVPDEAFAMEIAVPRPAVRLDLTLPVRIDGLNNRWSAGLLLKKGYVKGDYGPAENRYRALGLDLEGAAYVPLYVDRAAATHVVAGHPVTAGPEGKLLFIQVTKVGDQPHRWHVSVNNPTDQPITTTLKKAIDLPGLEFPDRTVTLAPGQYIVLQ
jgi:hypothetical protein